MDYWLIRYDNITTILLVVMGFVLVLYAQMKINTTYSKYRRVKNSKRVTGRDVARKILDSNGLYQIQIY